MIARCEFFFRDRCQLRHWLNAVQRFSQRVPPRPSAITDPCRSTCRIARYSPMRTLFRGLVSVCQPKHHAHATLLPLPPFHRHRPVHLRGGLAGPGPRASRAAHRTMGAQRLYPGTIGHGGTHRCERQHPGGGHVACIGGLPARSPPGPPGRLWHVRVAPRRKRQRSHHRQLCHVGLPFRYHHRSGAWLRPAHHQGGPSATATSSACLFVR